MTDLKPLMQALGYQFGNPALLEKALTHPSASQTRNNQRLEFLGDAVLQLCVSHALYLAHTDMQEGQLTNLRQHLVCQDGLLTVAEEISIGAYLRMDKSCEATGGRSNASVLSDAMEAVLAAVYLDGGFDAARQCVDKLWPLTETDGAVDAKSALQEYLQAKGMEPPHYRTISEEGPPHKRVFTAAALLGDKECARGQGSSKKRAEQAAAEKALSLLRAGE